MPFDVGQTGCTDIRDATPQLREDIAWVHESAREFATKVLDAEDSDHAEHYANWVTAHVLAAGGSDAFNPTHPEEMRVWASQGHGPDWLRPCTPPRERS
ncbi:hypothetical protein [Nocardia sp. NBC_00511]|uniref:hypothetical protein n=1 Tax=Nocardia sp. NBC_00511 TaxID=2903591 RepID=UPI002F91A61F